MDTRLKFKESICASYIFHMLSVANIGYDNEYGDKYRCYHDLQDLELLKKHSNFLTSEGGVHCGQLAVLMVGIPATYDTLMEMELYFKSIVELINSGDIDRKYPIFRNRFTGEEFEDSEEQRAFTHELYEMFKGYLHEIEDIAHIMIKNSSLFQEKIYDETRRIVAQYTKEFSQTMDKYGDLMSSWEKVLSVRYRIPYFNVILVEGIDNGAQAIDINQRNDVFGMFMNHEELVRFISHELGTYLIIENLSEEIKTNLFDYWNALESLSSCLNMKYITGLEDDIGRKEYIEWYNARLEMDADINIEQMIRLARKEIEGFE